MKGRHRRALYIALACWALKSEAAHAESRHRVVLLASPSEQEESGRELISRLRGELTASGLDVVVVPATEGVDVRDAVETSARELSPAAVIGVRYVPDATPGQLTAEVWISDRLSNRTLVQRGTLTTANSAQAARLAVQISELFKARLALFWVEPSPAKPVATAPCPPPPPPPPPPAPEVSAPRRLLLGAGLGMIHHFSGSLSGWFPTLSVAVESATSRWVALSVRVNAAWTPADTELERDGGAARISQGWGLLHGVLRFAPNAVVQPMFSLGAGAYGVRVKGRAVAPELARTERSWSVASTLGVGLWLEPHRGLAWTLEGQAFAPWSNIVVDIRGAEVATLGFPAAVISTSLLGRY